MRPQVVVQVLGGWRWRAGVAQQTQIVIPSPRRWRLRGEVREQQRPQILLLVLIGVRWDSGCLGVRGQHGDHHHCRRHQSGQNCGKFPPRHHQITTSALVPPKQRVEISVSPSMKCAGNRPAQIIS